MVTPPKLMSWHLPAGIYLQSTNTLANSSYLRFSVECSVDRALDPQHPRTRSQYPTSSYRVRLL